MDDVIVEVNNTILDEITCFTKSIVANGTMEYSNDCGNGALQGVNNVVVLENLKKSLAEGNVAEVKWDEPTIKADTKIFNN